MPPETVTAWKTTLLTCCFRNIPCTLPSRTNNAVVFICKVEWVKENFRMGPCTLTLVFFFFFNKYSLVRQDGELEEKKSVLDRHILIWGVPSTGFGDD